jgi:hypothetical protein
MTANSKILENPLILEKEEHSSDSEYENDEEENQSQEENEEENEEIEEEENENDEETTFKLVENTELYLLHKDNIPVCYLKNKEEAVNMMWKVARSSKHKYSANYNVFLKENDQNSISIVGYNRFFIVSYERLLSRFDITKIQELQHFPDNKNTKEEPKSSSRWW